MDFGRKKLENSKTSSLLQKQSRISTNLFTNPKHFSEPLVEDKKLSNWKKWLDIRKKDQENYKKILRRNELLLNSGENYRSKMENRELMEIASDPLTEAYLTKNIDLTFWNSPEILSNRGNPCLPDIEVPASRKFKSPNFVHITCPDLVLQEKGLAKPRELKNDYLQQKMKKHADVISIIDPNPPEMAKLYVQGKNVTKRKKIIRKIPIITITTAEETERETSEWSLNPDAMIAALRIGNEEIVRRLNPKFKCATESNRSYCWNIKFSSKINETLEKHIFFENKGNVKISYNWRPICQNLVKFPFTRKEISFYFNKNRGIILPGQILKFSVWFKAAKSGITTENWRFVTDPVLVIEDIIFRFQGCCTDEKDISKNKVQQIENYLNNRVRDSRIHEILEEIVNDALTLQESEPSYKDLFLDCDIFTAKNPFYFYNSILIQDFRELFQNILNSNSLEWNLSIDDLRNILVEIEDPEFRQEMSSRFVNLCKAALQPVVFTRSTKDAKYEKIYNLLCAFANQFEAESETIMNVCFESCQVDGEGLEIGNASQSGSNSSSRISTGKLTPKLKGKPRKKRKRDDPQDEPDGTKKWIILKPRDIILYEETFYLRIYEILKETISKACAAIDSIVRLNKAEN